MDLTALGLTQNESKAYETLLRLGKATAAHISKESGVPYGRIYPVLASLEAKGFARIVPEATKHFVPTDPEALHAALQEKRTQLDEFEAKIRDYKTIYAEHGKETVQVGKGKKAFYDLIRSMEKPIAFEYDLKYTFELHPEFIRETRELKKRKVSYKVIGKPGPETEKNIAEWKKLFPDIPFVPIENEGVAISLRDNAILIGLIKSNTTMVITDKPFIGVMRQLFENYYETHKKG